jgi:hypothetical protein
MIPLSRSWTTQPQSRPAVDKSVWPGSSQIVLPSLRFAAVIGGVETITGTNENAQFSVFSSLVGRVLVARPNSDTSPGEWYTWQTGNFNIGGNGSLLVVMAIAVGGFRARLDYGGFDWGLRIESLSTSVEGAYVDSPTTAGYTATLSSLPSVSAYQFRAIGVVKSDNTIKVFTGGRVAITSGGNGGIRRSAGSGLGVSANHDSYGALALAAATTAVLSDNAMLRLTDNPRAPWKIFAIRRSFPVSTGAVAAPTLTAAVAHNLGSTTVTPRVTFTR